MTVGLVTVALFVSLLALAFLSWRHWRLQQRYRCMRYAWNRMTDFAHKKVFEHGEGFDHHWRDIVMEHRALMRRFDCDLPSDAEAKIYEEELARRGGKPITEHLR